MCLIYDKRFPGFCFWFFFHEISVIFFDFECSRRQVTQAGMRSKNNQTFTISIHIEFCPSLLTELGQWAEVWTLAGLLLGLTQFCGRFIQVFRVTNLLLLSFSSKFQHQQEKKHTRDGPKITLKFYNATTDTDHNSRETWQRILNGNWRILQLTNMVIVLLLVTEEQMSNKNQAHMS